jgi:hypothetical protein
MRLHVAAPQVSLADASGNRSSEEGTFASFDFEVAQNAADSTSDGGRSAGEVIAGAAVVKAGADEGSGFFHQSPEGDADEGGAKTSALRAG